MEKEEPLSVGPPPLKRVRRSLRDGVRFTETTHVVDEYSEPLAASSSIMVQRPLFDSEKKSRKKSRRSYYSGPSSVPLTSGFGESEYMGHVPSPHDGIEGVKVKEPKESMELLTVPATATSEPDIEENVQEFTELDGKYVVYEEIGSGTFSSVYKARDLCSGEMVAIKRLVSTSAADRMLNESHMISILSEAGCSSTVPLIEGLKSYDRGGSGVTLVFPFFQHDSFRTLIAKMNENDMKKYMKALLETLVVVHGCGIVHRDVKPSNFLYNLKQHRALLIDYGLAYFVDKGDHEPRTTSEMDKDRSSTGKSRIVRRNTSYRYSSNVAKPHLAAPRAGTRGFRAPEVLFKSKKQGTPLDIWSAGVIFLSLILGRYPLFLAHTDHEALGEISLWFGGPAMEEAARAMQRVYSAPKTAAFQGPRHGWKSIVKRMAPGRASMMSDDAFDLLENLLQLIPKDRITALDSLAHPFICSIEN